MDDFHIAWPFLIPIFGIIGSFTYVIVLTLSRARVRELEVRERIAMIERGLVPPPEVDPRGFDRAMDRYERYRERSPGRHRRAYKCCATGQHRLRRHAGIGPRPDHDPVADTR